MAPDSVRKWKVVGISGVSGSGKTTLTTKLLSALPTTTAYLSQDQYILPNDYPGHLRLPAPLEGLNKDSIQSIETRKMESDLREFLKAEEWVLEPVDHSFHSDRKRFIGSALKSLNPFCGRRELESDLPPVLLLDGFLLFNQPNIPPMCDLRFFLTLTKEECWERRKKRTFTSGHMNAGDYFEMGMWPSYLKNLEEMTAQVEGIEFLDGATPPDQVYQTVLRKVMEILQSPEEINSKDV